MTSFYVTLRCAHCNRLVTRFRFTCQCTFNSRHLWLGKAKYPISQIFNNKKGEKSIIGVTCARATSITKWRRSILSTLHHLSPFSSFLSLVLPPILLAVPSPPSLSPFISPLPPVSPLLPSIPLPSFYFLPLALFFSATPLKFCLLSVNCLTVTMHSCFYNP